MKLLKKQNKEGIVRYYKNFHMEVRCFDFGSGEYDLEYEVLGEYWNVKQEYVYDDLLFTSENAQEAVEKLTELTKQLSEQPEYPYEVFYKQVERGESE